MEDIMQTLTERPIPEAETPLTAAVMATDLVKTYPSPEGGTFNAVDGVSLEVKTGEIFGFLGPNGAGKTTTLEIIEGLQEPSAGRTAVLGLDSKTDRAEMKERIGVQLQASSYFPHLTLEELLRLFGSWYRTARHPHELLDKVGLAGKRKALVGELSGGQAQRFSIVAALVNDPDVVFLDEPTTGLDPQARRNVWELIRGINEDEGKTVVLTTHYMDEAEILSHRVAIIDTGKIQAVDTPQGLITRLGDSHLVSFTLDGDIEDAALHQLDGVERIERTRNTALHFELSVADPSKVVPALYSLASVRSRQLSALQVHAPDLETVFLNVTGTRLRD